MNCRCPITPNLSYEALVEKVLPYNCSSPFWLCPNLDKELRRAEKTRDTRLQYKKRLKAQGLSDEQIANRTQRSRRTQLARFEPAQLEFDFDQPKRRKVVAGG